MYCSIHYQQWLTHQHAFTVHTSIVHMTNCTYTALDWSWKCSQSTSKINNNEILCVYSLSNIAQPYKMFRKTARHNDCFTNFSLLMNRLDCRVASNFIWTLFCNWNTCVFGVGWLRVLVLVLGAWPDRHEPRPLKIWTAHVKRFGSYEGKTTASRQVYKCRHEHEK